LHREPTRPSATPSGSAFTEPATGSAPPVRAVKPRWRFRSWPGSSWIPTRLRSSLPRRKLRGPPSHAPCCTSPDPP